MHPKDMAPMLAVAPALAHGNRVLWESNVITEYLDRVFPGVPLYPHDAAERLSVKRWQAAELAMAKIFRPLMYQRLMGPPDDVWADTQIRQWLAFDASLHKEVKVLEAAARSEKAPAGVLPVEAAMAILGARFDQLDAHLSKRSWLVGSDLSIADRALATRVHALDGLGALIGPGRRHLRDWAERTRSALC